MPTTTVHIHSRHVRFHCSGAESALVRREKKENHVDARTEVNFATKKSCVLCLMFAVVIVSVILYCYVVVYDDCEYFEA